MDARLEQIARLAFRSVPAVEANAAIAAIREAAAPDGSGPGRGPSTAGGPPGAPIRPYELVLAPAASFDSFLADQLPKLVYHLESIGAHPPRAAGVVICLFAGDRLLFLHAGELLEAVCGFLDIAPGELVKRYGTGEQRTAMPAALAALPPPQSDA